MTPNCLQKDSPPASHRDTLCSGAALSEHASASECQEELSESSESDCSDGDATSPCRQVMSSDYRRASTPAPAVQAGAGTFGDKDRFSEVDQTVGPGAYSLPELPATAGSGAGNFGQMTGERFETIEQTVGPGAYSLPELPATAGSGAGNFGQMTGERFETIEQTVGPGAYSLPELPATAGSGAGNFGQMTGERFETIEQTVGPGAYTLPPAGEATGLAAFATAERFEDIEETPGAGDYDLPTETVVCHAAFSKSNVERLEEPQSNSIVGPGTYESPAVKPLPFNARFTKASRGLKNLRKGKKRVGPGSYNPRKPKKSAKGAFSKSQREVASYKIMYMW